MHDRHVDDKRYEREFKFQQKLREDQNVQEHSEKAPSSAFDAFMRIQTGKGERTIAQKIADPHRPSWEKYKEDKKDHLDIAGEEARKRLKYRQLLDEERENQLRRTEHKRKKRRDSSSEGNSESSDSEPDGRKRKSRSKQKKKKKKKKRKKSK